MSISLLGKAIFSERGRMLPAVQLKDWNRRRRLGAQGRISVAHISEDRDVPVNQIGGECC
jgi:hypothetical protein